MRITLIMIVGILLLFHIRSMLDSRGYLDYKKNATTSLKVRFVSKI